MIDHVHIRDVPIMAAMAAALRPVDQDPARRLALRDRILGRAAASMSSSIGKAVRADEGRWRTLLPGLHVKFLRRHTDSGDLTALWRIDANASIPAHSHRREEECLVVSGRVRVGDVEYGEGDYLFADAGSRHPVFTSNSGATLLIRGEDPFLERSANA